MDKSAELAAALRKEISSNMEKEAVPQLVVKGLGLAKKFLGGSKELGKRVATGYQRGGARGAWEMGKGYFGKGVYGKGMRADIARRRQRTGLGAAVGAGMLGAFGAGRLSKRRPQVIQAKLAHNLRVAELQNALRKEIKG